jgi:hypothetical protein
MRSYWTLAVAVSVSFPVISFQVSYESVGTDTRKVVADGFPSKGVLASDIHQGMFNIIINVPS